MLSVNINTGGKALAEEKIPTPDQFITYCNLLSSSKRVLWTTPNLMQMSCPSTLQSV